MIGILLICALSGPCEPVKGKNEAMATGPYKFETSYECFNVMGGLTARTIIPNIEKVPGHQVVIVCGDKRL